MRNLKKQQQTASQAVARRFSARWEKRGDSCDAFVTIGRKRVAVDCKTLKQHGIGQAGGAKPRLRVDKVVTRLMEGLRATLGRTLPEGMMFGDGRVELLTD